MMRLPTLVACLACAVAIFPLAAQVAPATPAATPAAAAPAIATPAIATPAVTAPAGPTPAVPAPGTAAPAASTPAALTGNVASGRELTYTCQGCHGVVGYKNAYPNFHVPKIGGQSVVYISNALHEYRTGNRKHPTMQVQAQSFSEQDIADIAAYLNGLKGAPAK